MPRRHALLLSCRIPFYELKREPGKVKSTPVGVFGKDFGNPGVDRCNSRWAKPENSAQQSDINKSTAHRFLSYSKAKGVPGSRCVGTYMVALKLTHLGTRVGFHPTPGQSAMMSDSMRGRTGRKFIRTTNAQTPGSRARCLRTRWSGLASLTGKT